MTSQREYEQREMDRALREMERIRRAPLADRREAQGDFYEAMRDQPRLVAERIGWLLAGNYGHGAMILARRIIARGRRMNRAAALTQMIAVFEWQVPENMARDAWKHLSASEKHILDEYVQDEIEEAEEGEEE